MNNKEWMVLSLLIVALVCVVAYSLMMITHEVNEVNRCKEDCLNVGYSNYTHKHVSAPGCRCWGQNYSLILW